MYQNDSYCTLQCAYFNFDYLVFIFNLFVRTPLHWASATGQSSTVSTLLELNANPAPVDVEGATPLEYARQADHQGMKNSGLFHFNTVFAS